jgi:D-amino-acid dehydrogenase
VIGVTSAWRLALAGHEVVIVDEAETVASGASSANAGMIAPGHSFPWSAPGAPLMLARSLFGRQRRLRLGGRPDAELIRWGTRFLRECGRRRSRRNAQLALQLSMYSQDLLDQWTREHGIEYDARHAGALYLHHSPRELAAAERRSRLYANERPQRVLGVDALAGVEPALSNAGRAGVVGAIFDPADASGSAAAFTNELGRRCRDLGIEFLLGRRVEALRRSGNRVTGAVCGGDAVEADNFIVALGAASGRIAKTAGERLTLYPVHGCSASFPVRDSAATPELPGCDETDLVAWSRERDHLRMSTGAVFAHSGPDGEQSHLESIRRAGRHLFGDAVDFDRPVVRSGARSVTPDGVPVIGRGRRNANLFFNTGHGHVGWTMACGAAQIVGDLVEGVPPRLDAQPLRAR